MSEKMSETASIVICDMIKGNESLVENFKFSFLTPLSHFDANNNWIPGYRVMKNQLMLKTI